MALPSVCMDSLKVAQAELTRCHQGRREHGKKRSSSEHLTVTECTGEVGGRCERRREKGRESPGEPEREWEKCDMLPANGDAASHAPDRSSISAGRELFLGCGLLRLSISRTCPWQRTLVVVSASLGDVFKPR